MNNGILTQSAQPLAMPYGLLGLPAPVPLPDQAYAFDTDAVDYIRRVETADGQALEPSVRVAFDAFVRGCKADGTLGSIKAACILAGARTLSGALVPLVGVAPTSINFVSADYSRKTGLTGNGSSKYLNTARNNNLDPQNNRHAVVMVSMASTANQIFLGGRSSASGIGATLLGYNGTLPNFRSIPSSDTQQTSGTLSTAIQTLSGSSRYAPSEYIARVSGASRNLTSTSGAPNNITLFAFCQNDRGNPAAYSSASIAFYSIGEALDLALLDARVTTLMNTLAAVL